MLIRTNAATEPETVAITDVIIVSRTNKNTTFFPSIPKDKREPISFFRSITLSIDELKITIAPKGAGSENVSAVGMLKPSDGYEGVKQFVLDTILKAGGNPCPPIIVGVGVGGNFEKCALLSKQALMRPLEDTSSDEICARLEKELLTEIRDLLRNQK